jgi:nitroreductase
MNSLRDAVICFRTRGAVPVGRTPTTIVSGAKGRMAAVSPARRPAAAEAGEGLFEVIAQRGSSRAFTSKPVPDALLQQILQAANRAPSAGNLQAYRIFVVSDSRTRHVLASACGEQDWVAQAPVTLVFFADPMRSGNRYGQRGRQLYCVQDATTACAYAQLAATALGLGSVWVGAIFQPDVIRDALGITGVEWPVAVLPIGYPAERSEPGPRRPLGDLVSYLKG